MGLPVSDLLCRQFCESRIFIFVTVYVFVLTEGNQEEKTFSISWQQFQLNRVYTPVLSVI